MGLLASVVKYAASGSKRFTKVPSSRAKVSATITLLPLHVLRVVEPWEASA